MPAPRRQFDLFLRLTRTGIIRQTSQRLLGWLWWLIDPLAMITVYAMVFGGLLGVSRVSAIDAYPLFLACALIPWRWFNLAAQKGGAAFAQNASLMTSMPVSRDAIVLSEQAAVSVQGLAGVPVLGVFMIVYDVAWTWNLLYVPLALVTMALLAVGVGYLLCPLTVIVPDVANAWSVAMRVVWFLSPGLYSLEQFPEEYRGAYSLLNPLVGVFEGVRRPVHDGLPPLWGALGASFVWALLVFAVGRWVFRRLSPVCVRML